MKKLLLTLTFLFGIFCAHAAEIKVASLPIGSDYWNKNSSYTSTLTSNNGDWTIVSFNNNNNGWDHIRCGSKNNTSVAEIIYNKPVTEAVNKIVLNLPSINTAYVNSITFYRASNANFTDAVEIPHNTIGTGNNEVEITNPLAGQYYKVVFDLKKGTSNGFVQVKGFELWADDGAGEDTRTPVILSFGDTTEGNVTLGEAFTLPELTVTPAEAKSLVTFSSDNEAVATIDATTGAVTVKDAGTAVFTASFDGNDEYLPAIPAKFTLKVNKPLSGNELFIQFTLGSGDGKTLSTSTALTDYISAGYNDVKALTEAKSAWYQSDGGLKFGASSKNGSIKLELNNEYRISRIVVSAAPYSTKDNASIEVNGQSQALTGTAKLDFADYDFVYSPAELTNTISISTNVKRAFVQSLTIYFETGDVAEYAVAPQFSVEAGDVAKGTKVELTTETEGASIYYTLDGTTPTTESTLYTEPLTINATTTVSAIAVKEGMENSPVSKATYTVVPEYDTLAEFIAANPQENVIINAPLTVYYYGKSGNNGYLYVTDGTAKTFLWSNSFTGSFENGDVIPAGVVGLYNNRYNEVVVDANSIGEITKGAAIEPTVVTEVTKDMLHDYVKIEGVTISSSKITVGGEEITLYDRFNTTITEGENLTFVGIVNIYNANGQTDKEGTLQLYPIEIIEHAPTEVAALTITPEFGNVYNGEEITIDCATEGALLTGYIGSTELNGEAMPYTYTVSETTGTKIEVMLYGHKDGLTDSAELEGEYTVVERPAFTSNEVTFDWADISSLTANKEFGNATALDNDFVFTNKDVAMTFSKGTHKSSAPAYYANGNSLRFYDGNTMTIKLTAAAYHIEKVTLVYATGSDGNIGLAEGQPGYVTDGVWTPTEPEAQVVASRAVDPDKITEITFVSSAKPRLSTVTVSYTDVPTGIESVEAADSDAPAVFFNLQGIRVANPANGIFIRVQGRNVEKVLVK